MKRASGDKEDIIGANRAVLGLDRRTLDNREQVALNAFAGDVGGISAPAATSRHFVDLVQKDDATLFRTTNRLACHGVTVDQ